MPQPGALAEWHRPAQPPGRPQLSDVDVDRLSQDPRDRPERRRQRPHLPAFLQPGFRQRHRPYLQQYVRGSGAMGAEERVKILKLLWDAIGTEFAGRHELYERNYAGNHDAIRLEPYLGAHGSGLAGELEAFVESCLSEYDLNGWQAPDLFNPDDITALDDL